MNVFLIKAYLCPLEQWAVPIVNQYCKNRLHKMEFNRNNLDRIYDHVLADEKINREDGLYLYTKAPLDELVFIADRVRQKLIPGKEAGLTIDRNINITNICFSMCRFCNFCRTGKDDEAYITTIEQYRKKIDELFAIGGRQILLQGGMNPDLGIRFYTNLFRQLKSEYPELLLHALGPPEVHYLAIKEGISYREVLNTLTESGLDSLPGAGAEILSDRVRSIVSPAKASAEQWLGVMREAHKLNITTSATMMYGHAETVGERIDHLIALRSLQEERPAGHRGFVTFVPWPFMHHGTVLATKYGITNSTTGLDYVRIIAISRILLNNIINIQSSLLTVGPEVAIMTLNSGANDLGSIMMEENVVSSAGHSWRYDAEGIKEIIRAAGFIPRIRNQQYETIG